MLAIVDIVASAHEVQREKEAVLTWYIARASNIDNISDGDEQRKAHSNDFPECIKSRCAQAQGGSVSVVAHGKPIETSAICSTHPFHNLAKRWLGHALKRLFSQWNIGDLVRSDVPSCTPRCSEVYPMRDAALTAQRTQRQADRAAMTACHALAACLASGSHAAATIGRLPTADSADESAPLTGRPIAIGAT